MLLTRAGTILPLLGLRLRRTSLVHPAGEVRALLALQSAQLGRCLIILIARVLCGCQGSLGTSPSSLSLGERCACRCEVARGLSQCV